MRQELQNKYEALKTYLRELGSVAIAFSSGVDSTFLLQVAHDVLGDRAIAITAKSKSFPTRELEEATSFCKELGVRHFFCESKELEIEGFRENPKNRCYLCKRALFERMWGITREQGISVLAEGSNVDDMGDYRPGMVAIEELEVASPLRKVQLTKQEIRELSKELGLPTWDKPSFACLASRFVYGETIDEKKLHMVEQAEELLFTLGFHQFRVRMHGMLARIELLPEEFSKLLEEGVRQQIYQAFQSYGFTYVAMDLLGYRMGSMNETLER